MRGTGEGENEEEPGKGKKEGGRNVEEKAVEDVRGNKGSWRRGK
jgi:hypothetical protein